MQILVTGGTRFIGQHLAPAALKAGHRAVVGGRNFVGSTALLAAGGRARTLDLRERTTVIAACVGMDAVYHVGAVGQAGGGCDTLVEAVRHMAPAR